MVRNYVVVAYFKVGIWGFFSLSPCRDQLWVPPTLLTSGYQELSHWGKAAGAWSWPLIFIQCRDQECLELYIHCPHTPAWRVAKSKQRNNFTFWCSWYFAVGAGGEPQSTSVSIVGLWADILMGGLPCWLFGVTEYVVGCVCRWLGSVCINCSIRLFRLKHFYLVLIIFVGKLPEKRLNLESYTYMGG
jgi:hypothetical protein